MPARAIADLAVQNDIAPTVAHISVSEACDMASAMGPTLICGSFHVADEATLWLEEQRKREQDGHNEL